MQVVLLAVAGFLTIAAIKQGDGLSALIAGAAAVGLLVVTITVLA